MATINLEQWRDAIEQVLRNYAAIPYSYTQVEKETVFDRRQDPYLILIVGWEGHRYEHGCTIHIDMIGDKVWIRREGTEDGIPLDWENACIPKEHIVWGFKPPEVRPFTGYAIA
ncbi:XisI protein [Lyngbya sp. CCY1209]|uniref:XisI protein n=1 Tax=Lyngbya sp. CCY1209 TaxID=2886103 RepID=UPI002D2156F9|nr:XisI protein [Lyngbya sp. CCY1209]MEB3885821.1 XisI protein [Lyngbya sp. CCY1209]